MSTTPAPRTPGATRAKPGEHVFPLGSVNQIMGGPEYSPVYGGVVEGDRMIVGLMTAPAGGTSEPHHHPNEQWIYILHGTMDMTIDGTTYRGTVGDVFYIPSDVVHSGHSPGDTDAIFFTVKDTSHGLHGIKAT